MQNRAGEQYVDRYVMRDPIMRAIHIVEGRQQLHHAGITGDFMEHCEQCGRFLPEGERSLLCAKCREMA